MFKVINLISFFSLTRFGRRPLLLVSYLSSLIFAALSAFSSSYIMFVIMRFFTGMSLAGISIISIALSKEIISQCFLPLCLYFMPLFNLIFSLWWRFCRCGMVQHRTQDFFWCNYKSGLDSWKLASGWNCVLCEGVEDADYCSYFTPVCVHYCLAVIEFVVFLLL